MAKCNTKALQQPGINNPIQSKIIENDHGGASIPVGDNTITGASCNSSVAVGDVVRLSGSNFIEAQANTISGSNVLGVCTSKSSATICDVLTTGPSGNVFSGLTPGASYFLDPSSPGTLTTVVPTGAGNVVIHVGTAYSSQGLVFNPKIGLARAT